MTNKTTMPEPAHRGPTRTGSYFDSYSKQQMEAYKDACVREALEEAAMILKANAEACHSDTRIMLRANAEAILSLIKRID